MTHTVEECQKEFLGAAAEIDELITRLEAAEGPDRELDEILGRTFKTYKTSAVPAGGPHAGHPQGREDEVKWWPYYTNSMDAAIAFTETKLPGAVRHSFQKVRGGFHVSVLTIGEPFQVLEVANHKSEPIALLIATLKAMKAEMERLYPLRTSTGNLI